MEFWFYLSFIVAAVYMQASMEMFRKKKEEIWLNIIILVTFS